MCSRCSQRACILCCCYLFTVGEKRDRAEDKEELERATKIPKLQTTPKKEKQTAVKWLRQKQNTGTRSTYKSSFAQYGRWMQSRVPPRPVGQTTETDVVLYIRHMLEGKATVAAGNTIQVALAALKNHFKYDPSKLEALRGPMVAEALKVGKRDGKQVVKKKPLTVAMLHAMYQWYVAASDRTGASGWTDSRDLCMMILMMAAFLRESELIQLVPADIQIKTMITPAAANGQEGERVILEVYVRKAKNDQAGQGHLIRIAEAKESPICPVFWVKLLLLKQRNGGSCRFFHTYEGTSLHRSTPCSILQKWVARINSTSNNAYGDPMLYGSHSCRIGGVTAAHASGVDMTLVKQHGNWKSDVVFDYIQPTHEQQLSVTQFIQ